MQPGAQLIVFTSLLSAFLFARFAYQLAIRPRTSANRLVRVAHTCAWAGMGLLFADKAAFVLLATVSPERIGLISVVVLVGFVAAGVVVWGIGTYIVQVWLGAGRQLTVFWAGLAAAQTLLLATTYLAARPLFVVPDAWDSRIAYGRPDLGGLAFALAVPMLLFFVILCFYLFQVGLVEDIRLRWRIRCATSAMSCAFLATAFGLSPAFSGGDLPTAVGQVAGSVLAAGIIVASLVTRTQTSQALDAMTTRTSA